jgi:hypothetical protein
LKGVLEEHNHNLDPAITDLLAISVIRRCQNCGMTIGIDAKKEGCSSQESLRQNVATSVEEMLREHEPRKHW